MSKSKRIGAFASALFLSVVSVLYPVKDSFAFFQVPAAAIAAYSLRFAAPAASRVIAAAPELVKGGALVGKSASTSELIAMGSAALGTAIGGISVVSAAGTLLSLALDPREPDPTPRGWTAPASNSGASAMPPFTADSALIFRGGVLNNCHTSSIAETANCLLGSNPNNLHYSFNIQGGPRDAARNWPNNGVQFCTDKNSMEYCVYYANSSGKIVGAADIASYFGAPSGYANCTNGTCQLANPAAVQYPPDGGCNVRRNPDGTFSTSSRDPDCSNLAPGITVSPDQVSITAANGQTTTFKNKNGTLSVLDSYVATYSASDATKNEIYSKDFELQVSPAAQSATSPETGSASSFTGAKSSIREGAGSLAGNTAVPFTPPTSTPANPSTGTTPGTSPISIEFPNDYNREATQQQMLDELKRISGNKNVATPNSNVSVPSESIYKTAYPEETISTVFDKFKTDIAAAPFYSKAIGFFSLGDIGSGSCSGLNTNLSLMGKSIEIDVETILCSQMAMGVYQVLAIGVKIAFAVAAFSIAIL